MPTDPTPAAPDPAALVAQALGYIEPRLDADGAVWSYALPDHMVRALAAALTTALAQAAAADAIIRALVVAGHHAPWCDYIGASTAPYLPCNCEWDAATTAAQDWLTARAGAGE